MTATPDSVEVCEGGEADYQTAWHALRPTLSDAQARHLHDLDDAVTRRCGAAGAAGARRAVRGLLPLLRLLAAESDDESGQ